MEMSDDTFSERSMSVVEHEQDRRANQQFFSALYMQTHRPSGSKKISVSNLTIIRVLI